jgi:putative transposase
VAFIEASAGRRSADGLRWGVEPICRVLTEHGLQIAPSTYYAHRTRPPSARSLRDAELLVEIMRVHSDRKVGRGLYGYRKVWHQLRREGIEAPRCQVERLMKAAGLHGIRRGKQFVTTKPDSAAARPPDLVQRDFTAERPNLLWLVDFTYVPTWSGMAFTAFVHDAFSRRIVGWRTAASMPTELPLDALEMALWTRACNGEDIAGLVHHSDAGSQGGLNRSSQHLTITEVFDGTTSAAGGSSFATGDAIPWSPGAGSSCRAGVLAPDCARQAHGGGRARDRRVDAGRYALVSPRWRHAAVEPGRAHRPLPVVL